MLAQDRTLGECSKDDLRCRCEPRAGLHLCNKHACRLLLARTEKNRYRNFRLLGDRTVLQTGWLKREREVDTRVFLMGMPPCSVFYLLPFLHKDGEEKMAQSSALLGDI